MAIKMWIKEHKCSWRKRFSCKTEGDYEVHWTTDNLETTTYVCSECLVPFMKHCVEAGLLTATITPQEFV